MWDEPPVAHVLDIATSAAPLSERARGLVETLDRWLPVEGTWLALSDPASNVHTTVGSSGLERSVLDYLDRPAVAHEIQAAGLNQTRPPVSLKDLPLAAPRAPHH